jgi:hypothetical protein
MKLAYREAATAAKAGLPATKLQEKVAQDLSRLMSEGDVAELERAASAKPATPTPDVPPEGVPDVPPEGLPARQRGGSAGRKPKGRPTPKPPKLDLSKPGAFRKLAGASAQDVANALRDPALYDLFKAGNQKAIQDIAHVVAEHTSLSRGLLKVNPAVSEAIWALPEHYRGLLIERVLGETKYKGWFPAGQLDRGFFPQIDFAWTEMANGLGKRVSVKSWNLTSKGWERLYRDKGLIEHVDDLVSSTSRYVDAGLRPPPITLSVQIPQGLKWGKDLLQTLRGQIPRDLQKYIKIEVQEF